MAEQRAFDPSRYLTKVGNADYLEVKWRLVWLREIHPDAHLNTELISNGNDWAVFKATISVPGGGSASGFGSEAYNDFRDYLEKAETKAIGRALAALGFGTQFCGDFEYGATQGNVVDAPIDFASTRGRRMDNPGYDRETGNPQQNGQSSITPRQLKFIQAIAREKGMSDDELNADVKQVYGKASVVELDRRDGSAYIDRLQARRPAVELANDDRRFSQGETEPPAQAVDREAGDVLPKMRHDEDADPIGVEPISSWTYLWKELRDVGIKSGDIPAATDFIGTWNSNDPSALLATLRMKVASMPRQQGAAGNDRYTS